jgi:exoribonuclease-2
MLPGEAAPYPKNDTGLYTILRDFDTMYTIYNEFQRNMERYWCLRWLQQEQAALNHENPSPQSSDKATSQSTRLPNNVSQVAGYPASVRGDEREQPLSTPESQRELFVTAVVLRENLVKMTEIPLVFRASSLPEQLPSHTRVQLAVTSVDLLDLSLQTRYVATLAAEAGEIADVDEEEEIADLLEAEKTAAATETSVVAAGEVPAC